MGLRACVRLIRVFILPVFALFSSFLMLAQAQNIQWVRQFGTDRDEQANAVATTFGSVYVAGQTTGAFAGQTSAGSIDALVARYDQLGNRIWVRLKNKASLNQRAIQP